MRQSIETYNLRARYGIDAKEKNNMLTKQKNLCAICYNPFKNKMDTHVDHCHATNKLRGILCHRCNTGLGKFNDDPKLLQRAIYYIEYHAKQNQPSSLPTGSNQEGQDDSTHGPVHGAGTREDCDGAHHHIGEPEGNYFDSSAEEGGRVGMGAGVSEVGAFDALIYSQSDRDTKTKTDIIREYVEYICSESRELGMALRAEQEVRLPDYRREQPVQGPINEATQSTEETFKKLQETFDSNWNSEPTGTARFVVTGRYTGFGSEAGDEPNKI